jgi:anaerobic magnesium-protoporphyrin IX monomethyl ester cyclase
LAEITLLRPNTRNNNYQNLASDIAAIEPPLFMALRAAQLITLDPEIIDAEVQEFDIDSLKDERIEIFPTGNHPSAYIQQRDGIDTLKKELEKRGNTGRIWKKLPTFDICNVATWELFPMDKYRAHNWHCWGGYARSPYGVVASSYSCPYNCQFCCIKDYYGEYAERPINSVMYDIERLVSKFGVTNIKFLDELFFYKPERVKELCHKIIAKGFKLNIWAYARVDTIRVELLPLLRKAGFRWLCLGVESGNEEIRRNTFKGNFTNQQIREVCKFLTDSGIHINANYIFGFADDDIQTINETFNLATELNTEYANFYSMMAYPGSQILKQAEENGWELPGSWSGYSQYSYSCHPIRTKHLASEKILKFRDRAFMNYYTNPAYLSMMRDRFGEETIRDIKYITSINLKRKLLGD